MNKNEKILVKSLYKKPPKEKPANHSIVYKPNKVHEIDILYVPEDKIISRYEKCLKLLPELLKLCDIMHIYDNTTIPFRIFKKRKDEFFFWSNDFWKEDDVKKLLSLSG